MARSWIAVLLVAFLPTALAVEPPAPAPAATPAADADALARGLVSLDLDLRRKAVYALWGLADRAAPALPVLAKALADEDEYVRTTAEKTVLRVASFAMGRAEIWTPTFTALRGLLADGRPGVRRSAAMGLWSIGVLQEGAEGLADTALGLLSDADVDLRANGAGILANVGPWLRPAQQPLRERAVTALLPLTADADDRVRRSVAAALGALSMPAGLPALFRLAEDPEASVRAAALPALGGLPATDEEATRRLTLLRAALFEADPVVRASAANTLWALGRSAAAASADLQKVLREDPEPSVRGPAVHALGASGDRGAIGAVRRAADDPEGGVRAAAITALADFGPDAAPYLPFLVHHLLGADETATVSAAMTIGRLGYLAQPAVPAVLKALSATSETTRRVAVSALLSLAWADALPVEAIPVLLDVFARSADAARDELAGVLAVVPSLPAEAGPILRAAYRAERPGDYPERLAITRAYVVRALTRVVGPAEETLALLRPLAGTDDRLPRQAALGLVVLGKPEDRARALELLTSRMDGPNGDYAVLVLQDAGAHARPAAARLAERFRALPDTREGRPARHIVAGALARIGGEHAAEAVDYFRREVLARATPSAAANAAEALGFVEDPPPAVRDALVASLEDPDAPGELAVAACRALRRLGRSDARTFALLARASEHPWNGALRLAAGHALLVLAAR